MVCRENLDEAHGFGGFPGPGECANIGPAQRRTLYPELKRWFGIPAPAEEPADRRPEAELAALGRDTAASVGMREVHELLREKAAAQVERARAAMAPLSAAERQEWLRKQWGARLGDIAPNAAVAAVLRWKKQDGGAEATGFTLETEPGILVPVVLMRPAGATGPLPVGDRGVAIRSCGAAGQPAWGDRCDSRGGLGGLPAGPARAG